MKVSFAAAAVLAALSVAACDSGGVADTTAATTAAAPPAPAASPPPAAASAPSAELAGLSAPFATEADWVAACINDADLDKSICDCAGAATTKTLGEQALFTWVWEGYIQRSGMGQVRSKKWFTDNGVDTAAQQKFADEVGKCYVTQ
jgi:hypothetical protein